MRVRECDCECDAEAADATGDATRNRGIGSSSDAGEQGTAATDADAAAPFAPREFGRGEAALPRADTDRPVLPLLPLLLLLLPKPRPAANRRIPPL